MNEKSLSRDDLQYLFDKYKHVPNVNEIKFMGEVARFKPTKGHTHAQKNPFYRRFFIKNDEGETVKEFETAKVIVNLPSPVRLDAGGNYYPTRIPVFTSDFGVENFRSVLIQTEEGEEKPQQFIRGVGRVQNFNIVGKARPSDAAWQFLQELSIRIYGKEDREAIIRLAKILRLSIDSRDNVLIPLTNIWCDVIEDAGEEAKAFHAKYIPVQVNEVTLQGIVYMPPSIRMLKYDGASVHFKLRVKRKDEEGRNIPTMHESNRGYDYINIVGFGDRVEEWYEHIEQGHPVKVIGRLESSRYRKNLSVNDIQRRQLSEFLEVPLYHDYINDTVEFISKLKEKVVVPNFNVWATDIVYDEGGLIQSWDILCEQNSTDPYGIK